ncbi:MAG TPA: hypothetical protein PLZ47_01060 [Candidatus Cloacimonas acidaminovorans]|nr:hypothetical protein [Candidatus Cloacimonas acidaminovorans]HRS60106.1 hypothetical protein [Candidatus Cloacimonas sp.]HOS06712.1 hypothetical protein [Candidatus Cloacimonas acidaminovorans]HOT38076.1 hypothetical protein [Candidatus Cloacimonas acidaminovorans]HQF34611.1 hypothetical protein [Candidatus Cloacimonas acidaminovorans]
MQKNVKEALLLDKLFALLETNGEVMESVKHQKLNKKHYSFEELKTQNRNTENLLKAIKESRALEARLESIFSELSLLPIKHLKTTERLELNELFEIKSFLFSYLHLQEILQEHKLNHQHPLPDMQKMFSLLDPEGNKLPTFRIYPSYSSVLKKLTQKQFAIAKRLKEARKRDLEKAKQELGMPTLKEEFTLSRNRKEQLEAIFASKYFIVVSEGLANYNFRLADSKETADLKAELHQLSIELTEEENKILCSLTTQIQNAFSNFELAYNSAGEYAWDFCLAKFALHYNCCLPNITPSFEGIYLTEAVNLPLKLFLETLQRQYQPLNIAMSKKDNLITGPNMGGKSTALITIGQMCILASLGIPLPAKKAKLPLYDEVYYNHDAGENSETLSSFAREVVSLSNMLLRKGNKLVLLDEFAKGTNPEEGEAICVATLKYLINSNNTIISATHFSAPAELAGLAHFTIKGIDEQGLKRLEKMQDSNLETRLALLSEAMDYSLLPVSEKTAPPKCAIRIAGILGLPAEILQQLPKEKNAQS